MAAFCGGPDILNGKTMTDDEKFERLMDSVHNLSTMRKDFLRRFVDPRRDIDDECGFPKVIRPEDCQDLYDREAIAARVVEVMPNECWQVTPEVYEDEDEEVETEFEQDWKNLCRGLYGERNYYEDGDGSLVYTTLHNLSVQSRICQYGVLLYGFDDGLPLYMPVDGMEESNSIARKASKDKKTGQTVLDANFKEPRSYEQYSLTVNEKKPVKLLYLRTFTQVKAQIVQFEANRSSPRYGQPTMYHIMFDESDAGVESTSLGIPTHGENVHWTRILHVPADGAVSSSTWCGVSALKPVFNDVLGERKISGGSPEGFWKMCFTSLVFETLPALGANPKINRQQLKETIEEFQNGMQKFMLATGVSAKAISPQVTDPTPHHNLIIERICIKGGYPVRVFKGSERGELASSQDDAAWNDRVAHKQKRRETPHILVPFVNRLIMVGVLREPKQVKVFWPDITSMSAAEKATVAGSRQTAIGTYVDKGMTIMTPLDFWTREMGYSKDEAEAIIEAAEEMQEELAKAQEMLAATEEEADPFDEPLTDVEDVENFFCATGPGGGIDPTCTAKGNKVAHPQGLKKGARVDFTTDMKTGLPGPTKVSAIPGAEFRGRFVIEHLKVGTNTDPGTAPPPGKVYNPNVEQHGKSGVTKAARVGVPAMSVPPPPAIGKLPNLTTHERRVESAFIDAFNKDPDGMANKFLTLTKAAAKPGEPLTFGTDDAKVLTDVWSHPSLSPEQRAQNRATLNLPLHQTANAIAKRAFVQHLDTLKPGDEVMVTVGGCGAGKGYALKNVPQALEAKKSSKAVWDSAGDQNATENPWIQKELEKRGLKGTYVFVHADPHNQWAHPERGVVKRAADPSDGRMVDAMVFADSYAIGAKNHNAFHQKHKDNPNAKFIFLENSGTPKLLPGIPEAALKLDRHELAKFAVEAVAKSDAPPHVKRGATMGTRLWADEVTANVFCATGKGGGIDATCGKGGPGTPEFKAWFGQSKVQKHGEPTETAEAGMAGSIHEPLVVFHGTSKGAFQEFRKDKIVNPNDLFFGQGFYFTEDVKAAEIFAHTQHAVGSRDNPTVMKLYLKVEKPFDIDKDKLHTNELPEIERKQIRAQIVQRAFSEEGRSEALQAGRDFDDKGLKLDYKTLANIYGVSKVSLNNIIQSKGHDGMTVKSAETDNGLPGTNRFWIAFEPTQIKATTAKKFDPNDPNILNQEDDDG